MKPSALNAHPQPISDYDEALARVQRLQTADTEAINPLCRTQLQTHGRKVERAIVFLHGFTNCPQQFARLGQIFFAMGYNVLIPRLPHHGLADCLTDDCGALTVAELATFTDAVIDLAHGLGERVTLAGISLGGNLALWAGQQRADLELAVAVAPLFAPRSVPASFVPALRTLAERLPNFFIWWERQHKANLPGPPYAYPRFPTRGVAVLLQFARDVQRRALKENQLPQARSILIVMNANDPAVDNAPTRVLINHWRAGGATHIKAYEFDASLDLLHDLIDEHQVRQRTDIVYPVLVRLINQPQKETTR